MSDRAQAIDKPMVTGLSRDERIRQAAYHRFLARGGIADDEKAQQDWLDAEAEIDAERSE